MCSRLGLGQRHPPWRSALGAWRNSGLQIAERDLQRRTMGEDDRALRSRFCSSRTFPGQK